MTTMDLARRTERDAPFEPAAPQPPCASTRRRLGVLFVLSALGLSLTGCGTAPTQPDGDAGPAGDTDVTGVPDAVPRVEPKSRRGNPDSYVVFGKRYYVMDAANNHVERGIASWYGKKFHGRQTSNGEIYDMYAMTAAHKSLPLPTYVKVTNLENQRAVVVRVNDRGPFHSNRVIDLSYTAAAKLDIVRKGTGLVEVRAIDPRVESAPVIAAASVEPAPVIDPSSSQPVRLSADEAVRESEVPVDGAGAVEVEAHGLPVAVSRRSLVDADDSSLISGAGPTIADAPLQAGADTLAAPAENFGTGTPAAPAGNLSTGTPAAPGGDSPKPLSAGRPLLYLQLGAFAVLPNAERLASRARPVAGELVAVSEFLNAGLPIYRVRVGPLDGVETADALSGELLAAGLEQPRVIVE